MKQFFFFLNVLFLNIFRISLGLPNVTDYIDNDINLYKNTIDIFIYHESPDFLVDYIQFLQFIYKTFHSIPDW